MFRKLGLSEDIENLLEVEGIIKPTEVQRHCIPLILNHQDVIACAKTGSGKTAAYLLPILGNLVNNKQNYCVILAPTRELAQQIHEKTQSLSCTDISTIVITGQCNYVDQVNALEEGVNIIIATPGRLAEIFRKNKEIKKSSLKFCKFLVMDEADQLLGHGFNDDFVEIFEALPKNIRKLLFTATINPQLNEFINAMSTQVVAGGREAPVIYKDESLEKDKILTVTTLKQYFLYQHSRSTHSLLLVILDKIQEEVNDSSVMIFTNHRRFCFVIYHLLKHFQYSCVMLHAALDQQQRDCAMKRFRSKDKSIMVCTDLACRGLDIPHVDFVINYDMPLTPDAYVHRVGRTARSGRLGTSITLVKHQEIEGFKTILSHIGTDMEVYPLNKHDDDAVIERHVEVSSVLIDIMHKLQVVEKFSKEMKKKNKKEKKVTENKDENGLARKRKGNNTKNKTHKKRKID